MIQLKDVIHLYLGFCKWQLTEDSMYYDTGVIGMGIACKSKEDIVEVDVISGPSLLRYGAASYKNKGSWIDYLLSHAKPILRPLSDMKEEEMKELWKIVFKGPFHKNGTIMFKEEEQKDKTRWCLMSGVERLGIEWGGHIWADSDLHWWRHNQHELTAWLLSKSFDLFSLIPSGQAIDATTINNQKG